ncbi:Uncharacterised protein [Xylophilus ampelinus]|nr:Uncharacterised protein [Xylophilus ampelinus]
MVRLHRRWHSPAHGGRSAIAGESDAEQLRELTARLMVLVRHQSALLDKLTHENALLKRMKFAA